MPEARGAPQRLCASAELAERGDAVLFDVLQWGQPARAFALRISALGGLFDATRTADETRSKPHPQMLQELMREFGVDPERTLMIGDTTHDLQLAANAGTDAVAVAYGAHPPEQLGDLRPLTIAHSVPELQDWLARHG